MLVLTQSSIPIIGEIAKIFGYIIDIIFKALETIGIADIGLCIILFTIIAYTLMLPLTVKQQKFSRLSSVMNPEIQAIQKKYKDRKDSDSMMQMQSEMKSVYEKYGTSQTGGCLQMFIQIPIVFALYRVIINIPAYIPSIKAIFTNLVNNIVGNDAYQKIFTKLAEGKITKPAEMFKGSETVVKNRVIDVLYKFEGKDWTNLTKKADGLKDLANSVQDKLQPLNTFCGLNLSESPLTIIKNSMSGSNKDYILCFVALMIPILSGVTQYLNMKLMPQQKTGKTEENSMMSSMNTMNKIMPIMSIVFCFSFASGIGIYWIMSAVVRSIQQFVVNKKMEKISIDDMIKRNMEKVNKKRAKQGLPPKKVTSAAKLNTKAVEYDNKKKESNKEAVKKSSDYYNNNTEAKPGSLKSKANMVKQFNEKNIKK